MDILNQILVAWTAQSQLEMVAVICGILYLVLVVKENIWCWVFAFVSTSIYIYLFHAVSLFSESLLNVFYLVMAVYGWWQWTKGQDSRIRNDHHKPIIKWPWQKHLKLIVITGLCVPILGYYMSSLKADFAYWDAFTTCFAVVTTFLVVWKVFENWYYWLVINSVSAVLMWQKGLFLTASLFGVYLVMILLGIVAWQRASEQQ